MYKVLYTIFKSRGGDGWNPVGSLSPIRMGLLLMLGLMIRRPRQGWRRFPDGWHKQRRGRGKIERNMVSKGCLHPETATT